MGMFGRDASVTTTFNAKDNMSPVVRGIRRTMDDFKRDAKQGFGLAAGISVFGAAQAAIGAVVDVVRDGTRAYQEDQLSQVQLRAALEANIKAWDGNADAIEDVIAARMRLGFSDDEQRSSLSMLVAQVQDVNDALAIQRTAMDLARLKGTSLAEASTLLAKAYNGSVTGLQRMGIQLRKGAKGMEAIEAVQKRAAGQAETYAASNVGAIAAMNVKVGELQEKVGEFVAGPAGTFIDFLSGVVDVIDGPSGASASIRDLTGTIVMLRGQTDALSKGSPFERMATDMAGWNEQLRAAEEIYRNDTWFKWVAALGPDTLRNFGKAGAETMADVRALAQGVIDAGGSFGEFAAIVRQKVAPSFNVLTSTWGATMSTIEEQTQRTAENVPGIAWNIPMGVADALRGGKKDVRDAMRDLIWTMEHPWAGAKKRAYIQAKLTGKRMVDGINSKNPDIRQAAIDARAALLTQWNALPAKAMELGRLTIAELIRGLSEGEQYALGLYGQTGTTGGDAQVKKNRKRKKRNAMGGSFADGDTLMVGENGPEVLTVSGGGGGQVTPNHHLNRPIIVNVDGRRLFEITDARSGRAIAMGGA